MMNSLRGMCFTWSGYWIGWWSYAIIMPTEISATLRLGSMNPVTCLSLSPFLSDYTSVMPATESVGQYCTFHIYVQAGRYRRLQPWKSGKSIFLGNQIYRAAAKNEKNNNDFLVFIQQKLKLFCPVRQPEILAFLLIIVEVRCAQQFWMKLYYLQCKQFQFVDSVLFGQVT